MTLEHDQLLAIIASIRRDKVAAGYLTSEMEQMLKSEDPRIWMRAVLAFARAVAIDAMVREPDRKAAQQLATLLKPFLDAQAN